MFFKNEFQSEKFQKVLIIVNVAQLREKKQEK